MKIAVAYSTSKILSQAQEVATQTTDILITVCLNLERKTKFLNSIVQRKPISTPGVEVMYMQNLNISIHNGGLKVLLLLSLSSVLKACMQMDWIWVDMLVMELNSL